MAITIRKATKNDGEQVAKLAAALAELHVEWDPKRFTQVIGEGAELYYADRAEAEGAAIFVAENTDEIVGFAYLEYELVLYAELATNAALLHDIYVAPSARGAGAGRRLLAEVYSEAKRLGADKVLLSVAASNEHGRHLFEQNGFRKTMFEMMLEID